MRIYIFFLNYLYAKITAVYYLIYFCTYLLSLLPFRILYWISDALFVILYYLISYRKKVVRENLRKSFPLKSKSELHEIEIQFYKHLADLIVEVIKLFSISEEELKKRCVLDSDSRLLLNRLYSEKKSLVIVTGHLGNWEWTGSAFQLQCDYPLYVLYRPIGAKAIDRLMIKLRSRFGNQIIPMQNALRNTIECKNQVIATAYISDQAPPPENAYWTNFLNQDTPIFTGSEKIARKFNSSVIYFNIRLVKRGFYKMNCELISENPSQETENSITEKHSRFLERDIVEAPANWLWSHKRWKHKRRST